MLSAAVAFGAGCGGPPPPVVAPTIEAPAARAVTPPPPFADPWAGRMANGVTLPYAVNVLDMADGPVVSVRGADVLVDGAVVDTAASLTAGGSRLHDALVGKRTATGVVLLQLPQDLPVTAVVAVVHAAADAGYASPSFMVNEMVQAGGAARIARFPVVFAPAAESWSSEPGGREDDTAAEPEKILHVEITSSIKYTLTWKQGDTVVSQIDVPRGDERSERGGVPVFELPGLVSKVQSEWKMVGTHRDPADTQQDRAVLHLQPTATHAYAVAAMDAILRSHRPTTAEGSPKSVPTFRVSLAEPVVPAATPQYGRLTSNTGTSITVRQGPVTVNGRLPPEVIQRIARQNFGRFRLCYENGLRTNPKLAGRVAIKFTIDTSGSVSTAADDHSTLPDLGVVSCIARGFGNLSFPPPERGDVKVRFELVLDSS